MKKENHLDNLRIRCLFYLFRLFPIKQTKIVFCNYVGKGYGCNPKYIAEEIIRQKKDWDLVWLTDFPEASFPKEIRIVKYKSVKAVYELATAKVWVDNQRKLPHYRKRKSQLFIETWHGGGGPMKKIGADNPRNFDNKPYARTSKHMDKITNVMISNSTCCTKIYRSAFLYTGEIMECGYPRNDILLGDTSRVRNKIYDYFQLPSDRKTVLYAPTYRNSRTLDHYKLDMKGLREALAYKFGGIWTVFLRLHPTMIEKAGDAMYSEYILNATDYDDMQELLSGSDILISDYSSVISEFALTGKPILLFATDVYEYAVERDFYVDYFTLPFPIAKDNTELVRNINEFDYEVYQKDVAEYLKSVGMADQGYASKRVVKYIEDRMYHRNTCKEEIR